MINATSDQTVPIHAAWYARLWDKVVAVASEYGTMMMTGSVALFQWFFTTLFKGVGTSDSLGISFDRLLVVFVCAYTALPLLLVAHVAAAKDTYKWPRIIANVCLALLAALVAEFVLSLWTHSAQWPVGSLVLVVGSGVVSWSQYRALAADRKTKGQSSVLQSTDKPRGRFSLPLSRSQLVVAFGVLAATGAIAVGWVLNNQVSYRYFHPYSGQQTAPSALCLFERMSDSLANGVVTHASQRDFLEDERQDSIFVDAQSIGFPNYRGPREVLGLDRRLTARSRFASECDSVRLASIEADLKMFEVVRGLAALEVSDGQVAKRRAEAASDAARKLHADSLLKQCAVIMQRADTVFQFAAAIRGQGKLLFGVWIKRQWARHINQVRRWMVLTFSLAGLILAVWVGGTPVYTASRIKRQIATLIALLIFAVPLLPPLRSEDMNLTDPSKLFQFPQWSAVGTASAPDAGRPKKSEGGSDAKTEAARADSTVRLLQELRENFKVRIDSLRVELNSIHKRFN